MNPLSGAPKQLLTYLGGNSEYLFRYFKSDWGIDYTAMKKLFEGASGGFDLVPKDPFNQFRNESWFKEWEARILLEQKFNSKTEAGMGAYINAVDKKEMPYSWFPDSTEMCFKGIKNHSNNCAFNNWDWTKEAMVTIQNETFSGSQADMTALFKKYVRMTNNSEEIFEECRSNNVYLLKNPEVPVTLVYGSHLATRRGFKWDHNPAEKIEHANTFASACVSI